jgi:hypothetical protein
MRRLFDSESELGFDSDSEKTYFDLEVHVDWCSANTLIWWSSILILLSILIVHGVNNICSSCLAVGSLNLLVLH